MRLVLIALMAALLTGCGTLIPKKVELFQDKVERFPDRKSKEREIQRQAAERAARDTRQVVESAIDDGASTNVLRKAKDAAVLTDAVSDSIGPPLSPSEEPAEQLADKLDHSTAALNERMDSFKKDNDGNVGKKIEGTGLIQVSYFAWLGGFLGLAFLGYLALKVITVLGGAANPAVGLGLNVLNMGSAGVAKAFSQVVKGCKAFKQSVDKEIEDPAVREKVMSLFKAAHNKAQDEGTRQTIDYLTKD